MIGDETPTAGGHLGGYPLDPAGTPPMMSPGIFWLGVLVTAGVFLVSAVDCAARPRLDRCPAARIEFWMDGDGAVRAHCLAVKR